MRTIVVGVTKTNHRIIRNSFSSFDHSQPLFLDDAAVALEHIVEQRFRLAIVSKSLPMMSGTDFTRELRFLEVDRYTPVLLIGEQFVHEEIVEAIQAGVNQILLMPLTPDQLEKKVKAVRKLRA